MWCSVLLTGSTIKHRNVLLSSSCYDTGTGTYYSDSQHWPAATGCWLLLSMRPRKEGRNHLNKICCAFSCLWTSQDGSFRNGQFWSRSDIRLLEWLHWTMFGLKTTHIWLSTMQKTVWWPTLPRAKEAAGSTWELSVLVGIWTGCDCGLKIGHLIRPLGMVNHQHPEDQWVRMGLLELSYSTRMSYQVA